MAVASKFPAVGSVVSWARACAGAVATQAFANVRYGPDGLERLVAGESATDVVAALTAADPEREQRQVGIVDGRGNAATFTGAECFAWAGGRTGHGYCCQGNILAGPGVVDAMCDAFEKTSGELAERLLAALEAGDAAGGDSRGRQSAALLVVSEAGGYLGETDVAVDVRVDDHPEPIPELRRIFAVHREVFPLPGSLEFVDIDDPLAQRVRDALAAKGYSPGSGPGYDDELKAALWAFVGRENLENRWSDDLVIERVVLSRVLGTK